MKSGKTVFVREATGLVKQISFFSTFAYNVNSQNPGFVVTTLGAILAFLPGADALSAFILCMILSIPFLLVYAFFTAAMPRSGGDYVFISRTLFPILGWMAAAVIWIDEIMFMGINASWTGSVYVSSAFGLLGNLVNSSLLTNLGVLAGTPTFSLIIGTIVLIGIGITMVLGTKVHVTFQNVLFFVGTFAALVMIGVLATSTPSQFHATFNVLAQPYTNATDPYSSVTNVAEQQGFAIVPSNLYMTLVGGTSAFSAVAFANFSTYCSGEMRRANDVKRQVSVMVGSLLFNSFLGLMIGFLLLRVAGTNFVAASYYLAAVSPSSFPYPIAPFLNLFVGMLTTNIIINAIMAVGWIVWGITTTAILFLMLTRILFAWSYDRLVPAAFAKVDDRFHGPIIATIAVIIAGELSLYIFSQLAPGAALFFVTYVSTAGFVFTAFLLTPISAIVFPFRAKELFRNSVVSTYKIGKVPLMSILGVMATAYVGALVYFFLTVSSIGVNSPPVLEALGGIMLAAIAAYGVIAVVRKRQSIDIGLVFKQIPPE